MKVVARPLVDHEHRLALTLLTLLIVAELAFLYLDVVFLRQPAQRLRIGYLLVLHQEVHGIATLATREALTYLTGWRHHERRCLVVVEWTQALVVNTRLAEVNKLAYDIHDVHGIHNLIDGRSVYHNECKVTK